MTDSVLSRRQVLESLRAVGLCADQVLQYHANEEKAPMRKIAYITESLDRMLEVRLAVRILHDSKQLSLKKYALLCEQMVTIEKNLKDWKKYHQNSL